MLQGRDILGKLRKGKPGLMLTGGRVFTPRERWVDEAKKYCSRYTWGVVIKKADRSDSGELIF